MRRITVILPAYNEEDAIGPTLKAIKELKGIDQIVVVNDGSQDGTSQRARQEGVTVLDLKENVGKGGAMNAAVPLVENEVVVFLDADLGESAKEAWKIIQPVLEGKTDLCIAAFPPPSKKGGFGLVKGLANWAIQKAGKIQVQSPLSGQRAMTVEVLRSITPFHSGYGVEVGMTIRALLRGYRVMEVTTTMKHQETGRDLRGFLHRGKQFLHVLRVISQETRGNRN